MGTHYNVATRDGEYRFGTEVVDEYYDLGAAAEAAVREDGEAPASEYWRAFAHDQIDDHGDTLLMQKIDILQPEFQPPWGAYPNRDGAGYHLGDEVAGRDLLLFDDAVREALREKQRCAPGEPEWWLGYAGQWFPLIAYPFLNGMVLRRT